MKRSNPEITKIYPFSGLLRLCLAMIVTLYQALPAQAHGGACGCSSLQGTGLAGPIITIPAYGMQPGVTSVSLGLGFHNSGRIAPNDLNTLIKNKVHADDNYGSLTPVLAVSHGFTDRFSLGLSMPFVMSFDFREVHGGQLENLGDSIGFGDLIFMSKYKFYDNHRFQSALLAGIEFPTGKTTVYADQGERFETLNQPGSGSFDPLFGIALSKQFDKFALDSNFLYKLATKGAQSTVTGDLAYYNLAVSYALNHEHDNVFEHQHDHHSNHDHGSFRTIAEKVFPEHILGQHLTWDLILEANTLWQEAPEVLGETIPNHGGTTVYLSPGLRMVMNDNWVYNLSLSMPVIQALNGLQGGSDMQLSFSVATSF